MIWNQIEPGGRKSLKNLAATSALPKFDSVP